MLAAKSFLFKKFAQPGLLKTARNAASFSSFSNKFLIDPIKLSNLSNEQTLLVCKDSEYQYFQQFINKYLPRSNIPLLVPSSFLSVCKYSDPATQLAFQPIHRFAMETANANYPFKYCQNIMFSPCCTSTQTILEEHYSKCLNNICYFAASMTKGRGRASNKWESHAGGLMFSYTSRGKLDEAVYQPYIDSLCLVKSIRPHIPDTIIKWPNDIYIQGKKVAGIICNATNTITPLDSQIIHGIGINFSNQLPTICLRQFCTNITVSDLLKAYNFELNYYMYMLEHEGFEAISREYQNYWMHGDYKIDVFGARGKRRRAKVVGISLGGNLELQYLDTGEKQEFDYKEYGIDIERACIKHKYAR